MILRLKKAPVHFIKPNRLFITFWRRRYKKSSPKLQTDTLRSKLFGENLVYLLFLYSNLFLFFNFSDPFILIFYPSFSYFRFVFSRSRSNVTQAAIMLAGTCAEPSCGVLLDKKAEISLKRTARISKNEGLRHNLCYFHTATCFMNI